MSQTMNDRPSAGPKRSFANPAVTDLSHLPAYVEPPYIPAPGSRKAGRNSPAVILAVALGAGLCGGVTYREFVSNPFGVEAAAERTVVADAPAYTPPAPYVPIQSIPLPIGAQLSPMAVAAIPPGPPKHVVASNHAAPDRGLRHPARLTRPSNG